MEEPGFDVVTMYIVDTGRCIFIVVNCIFCSDYLCDCDTEVNKGNSKAIFAAPYTTCVEQVVLTSTKCEKNQLIAVIKYIHMP